MRFTMIAVCAVLASSTAALAQVDADEVNRTLQGGQGPIAAPVQDQDRRNGTIHLQGGKGNLPAPQAPVEQDQDKRNGTIHLQGGIGNLPTPLAGAGTIDPDQNGTIGVDGSGEVTGEPDTALVDLGVATQATTASGALHANIAAMAQLFAALHEAGIEGRDIQTSRFSVSPKYVYPEAVNASGNSGPLAIAGYHVANGAIVRVRDLAALGPLLDRVVAAGANTINGVTFTIDDPARLYSEARRKAFGDALAKATLYAELAGVELGEIAMISESAGGVPPFPALDMKAIGGPVPIEPGELRYPIHVRVTWKLQKK